MELSLTGGKPVPTPDEAPEAWALRRAEELIASLTGVLSARIVAGRSGEIEEVHVLTTAGVAAKQVVRNVESALRAQLDLKVDHRKISVAQTADLKPIQVLERDAVSEAASRRKLVYVDMVVESPRPRRVSIRVMLKSGGLELEGAEEGVDEPRSRMQMAARAAVKALERELEDGGVVLEGVRIVEAFDRKIVLAAVHGVGGRNSHLLVGTAEVKESAEQAAVLAVLDATNRWYMQQR